MAKSSGIAYFGGTAMCHNAEVTDMSASVQPVVKVFPRNIGGVLKGGGVVSKKISVQCRTIPPSDATRGQVEQFMNTFNERFGPLVTTLTVDDNDYYECAISSVKYQPTITDGFIVHDVEFELGSQNTNNIVRQLTPGKLYADTLGRKATFVSNGKTFYFWHNVDIVRDLENRLDIELYDIHDKDNVITFNGGFEKVHAYCWMKASGEDQEDGWKQTVGAYIYNIMTGPLGDIGTLYLGGNILRNCLFTDVKLVEVFPTSARYELTFMISLQC